jgi:hypothetical protein
MEVAMDDKANYKEQIHTLAILAMNLVLENDYYKRKLGEIAGFRELPETVKKLRELQAPLDGLKKSTNDQDAATALRAFLSALAQFHH